MMAQAAKPRTSAKAVRIALLDLGRLISVRRKSSVRSLGLIPDCFTLVSEIVVRCEWLAHSRQTRPVVMCQVLWKTDQIYKTYRNMLITFD